MALLKFKHGLQANLNTTNAPISEGTVYITTDSQEMKVDLGGKRLTISDFVIVANNDALAALKTAGTCYTNLFYYVEDKNLLKKYNGTDFITINDTTALLEGLDERLTVVEGQATALRDDLDNLASDVDALDATSIETTDEITVTKAVGNYAVGKKINANTDLQTLILEMLCADSKPSVTSPSVSLKNANTSNAHTYIEVGGSSTLSFTATFEDGKYPYGYALNADGSVDTTNGKDGDKAAGVKDDSNAKDHPGVTKSAFTITYDGASVASDVTSDTLTASVSSGESTTAVEKNVSTSVTYSGGYIPVSILKNKYQSAKIQGSTKTASQNGFRWYLPAYYGFKYEGALIADPEAITAEQIKQLGTTISNEAAWNFAAPTNAKASGSWRQYFVAIPVNYGKEIDTVIDTTNQPLTKLTVKKKDNVIITFGNAKIEYKVYYISFPTAYDTLEFNLTWK